MKKYPYLFSVLLATLLLVGTRGSGTGEMRTWTSVSGATVEAHYIGMEQGEIIVQGPDGLQFTIRPDLLSEADQQYAREQLGIAPDTEPPTAEQPAKPTAFDSSRIPNLNLNQPGQARFIGFQTGEIPVFPLAMKTEPSIMQSRRGTGFPVVGTISAGSDFVLIGPRRLIESFVVELHDADGNVVETASVTARATPPFPRRLLWVYEANLQRARPGQDYTAIIKGDLGPVIGPVQNQMRVSIR